MHPPHGVLDFGEVKVGVVGVADDGAHRVRLGDEGVTDVLVRVDPGTRLAVNGELGLTDRVVGTPRAGVREGVVAVARAAFDRDLADPPAGVVRRGDPGRAGHRLIGQPAGPVVGVGPRVAVGVRERSEQPGAVIAKGKGMRR